MGQARVTTKDYCAEGLLYAQQVVSGEIPACRWVRAACQRQIDDLAKPFGTDWPWLFNKERANKVCIFLENLPHVKGRWKTKDIKLEPWQCFTWTTIFGWIDEDGWRRFRTAYQELPRKNSKTTGAAGIGLYMLCEDGEPGSEVYSAAVTKDQAKICWDTAHQMVKREAEMQGHYGVQPLAHSIVIERDGSYFKPLARDADSLEGLNPHCAIVDELHAHKTREVWDVLNIARGSRRQSLLLAITTAGDNKAGVCYEQHSYVEEILSGHIRDDRYWGVIYSLDSTDDWTTVESSRKANPNYGVSVLPDDIEMMNRQAQANSQSQNTYLNKRLNIWTSVGTAYFNMLAWENRCKDDKLKIEDFANDPCMITLDLASKRDLTTKITLFSRGNDYYVFGKHYLPADAVNHGNPNYDFYRGWEKDGWLTVTEGDETDYSYVERDLLDDMQKLKPIRVGLDPAYNAAHFSQRMRDAGVPVEEVKHNVLTFSEPMKSLEAMIIGGRIHHNGDPVLAWAMGNVMAKEDVKGGVYPKKAREVNKIDPAVALIANMSLQMRVEDDTIAYTGLRSVG